MRLLFAKYTHSKSYMKEYNSYLSFVGLDCISGIKYIHPTAYIDLGYASHIHIGENLVVSINSIILAHDYSLGFGLMAVGKGTTKRDSVIIKDVHIGNNVFVGANCVILPGTTIGDNCIIGAGSVCSGIVSPRSVVVGCKAKTIKSIDDWIESKDAIIRDNGLNN